MSATAKKTRATAQKVKLGQPKLADMKTLREKIVGSFDGLLAESITLAKTNGMSFGQWQDTIGEINHELLSTAHWSCVGGWRRR